MGLLRFLFGDIRQHVFWYLVKGVKFMTLGNYLEKNWKAVKMYFSINDNYIPGAIYYRRSTLEWQPPKNPRGAMVAIPKIHLTKSRLKSPLKLRLNLKTEHRNILTNVVIMSNNTTTINGDVYINRPII